MMQSDADERLELVSVGFYQFRNDERTLKGLLSSATKAFALVVLDGDKLEMKKRDLPANPAK
jgi:hypothetical protein